MKKNPLFYALLVLLTSCNDASSSIAIPSPEISSSSTALAVEVASPTALPTQTNIPATALPSPLPDNPPPTVQVYDQPFSAIIAKMYPGPFLLLGGTENGKWLSPETVAPHLSGEEIFQTYGYPFENQAGPGPYPGPLGSVQGKALEYDQFCQGYQLLETGSHPFNREVGVSGTWDAMPRLAQEISTDQATYLEALKNWLVGQNIPEPMVEISQILRVDIEGDGTEEVLINASHFIEPTGHSVAFGDYSLVLMRKVVGNSVMTIPIVADYYYQDVEIQFPLTYGTLLVADLNADGTLEILVGIKRWEGTGVIVYEVEGTNVRKIFEVICGL